MNVKLDLELSSNGLVTQRNLNNTLVLFVGGLLGSVFGLMGSFGAVLGVVEVGFDAISGKIKKDRRFREIRGTREKLVRLVRQESLAFDTCSSKLDLGEKPRSTAKNNRAKVFTVTDL